VTELDLAVVIDKGVAEATVAAEEIEAVRKEGCSRG
jgi:hypothetical protein